MAELLFLCQQKLVNEQMAVKYHSYPDGHSYIAPPLHDYKIQGLGLNFLTRNYFTIFYTFFDPDVEGHALNPSR